MLINDIQVPENENNDDATMVYDHVVQMVNDAYKYVNENPNVNCENGNLASVDEMNDINQYQNLIEYAMMPL